MPKKISDIALAKVPSFANRVSLFQSKLQITGHASGIITDYSHALYKSVAHLGKLSEEFTQQDTDGYMAWMLSRQLRPAISQFKHFVHVLKSYLCSMGHPDLAGLTLPKIRRKRKLPKILSVEQVRLLLRSCELNSKAQFSVIYDCGLRAFEACGLCWTDISFNCFHVHVRKGKGGKDRVVLISPKTLKVLAAYRRSYPSMNLVFKKLGCVSPIDNAYIRSRHYGLLSPFNRDKLRKAQEQLGSTPVPKVRRKKTLAEICGMMGWEVGICPCCMCRMEVVEYLVPARAPPLGSYLEDKAV